MKKYPYAVILFGLVLIGFILACNLLIPPEQVEPTPTATLTVANPTATQTLIFIPTNTPTPQLETSTPYPTRTPPPTLAPYATPVMAPFCDEPEVVSQSACEYPIAQQTGAFCVNKSPYNLIALNDGATYELLQEHVQCEEAGVQDGQRNIVCTGPFAYYFELKVCDSTCSALQVDENLDHCPFGYAYNNLQDCCTRETQVVEQGCIVLKLKTISCSVDCSLYTNRTTCGNYGYYCRWNSKTTTCDLRK